MSNTVEVTERPTDENGSLRKRWKLSCAIVYLAICIFDFMVMPTVYTNYNRDFDYSQVFAQVQQLSSEKAQVALIGKIDYSVQNWEPLTLVGGGLFHLAFGAILTGAAVKESREKITKTIKS